MIFAIISHEQEEFMSDDQESSEEWPIGDYTDIDYGGAPDECDIHWPTKLDTNGNCPIVGCRFAL